MQSNNVGIQSESRGETDRLRRKILEVLPFEPYDEQLTLIDMLSHFCIKYTGREVFLLNGYAGSGKTSIIGALVKAMAALNRKTVTLAPTGRAAKVAANFSAGKASTIHRRIFRADMPTPMAKMSLAPNNSRDTIFIIDEASLITDIPGDTNGGLLSQLVRYVYSGRHCAMILLGDIAQLPPVGQSDTPAMSANRLAAFGLRPICCTLEVAARQLAGSGILYNATYARQLLLAPIKGMHPKIVASPFDDVQIIQSNELADMLQSSWSEVGIDETIIITRSNIRANKYNLAIRNQVLMAEEPLQQGDRIVIAKNDYHWSAVNKLPNMIANGDTATVSRVGSREKMYGRYFCDVELTFPPDTTPVGAKLMLRSLMVDGPSIARDEMDRFYTRVLAEYDTTEGTMTEKITAALQDPYYNALQAKYGYCLTCHKSQGGQWKHVYVDMAGIAPEAMDETFLRWMYTAVTRATEKVFFINPTLPIE